MAFARTGGRPVGPCAGPLASRGLPRRPRICEAVRCVRPSLLLAAVLLAPVTARAEHVDLPDTPHANDFFGRRLALDGDTLAVGVEGSNAAGFDAGRVHVYVHERGEWVLEGQLDNPGDEPAYGNFGTALALDGDTLVVGATRGDGYSLGEHAQRGAVHVYARERGRWRLQASLDDPDTDTDSFGGVVAVSGDTLAVGADARVRGRTQLTRQVHVFRREGDAWALEVKIDLDGVDRRTGLGLGSDTLLVTAPQEPWLLAFRREGGAWREEPLPDLGSPRRYVVAGDTALVEVGGDVGFVVLRDRDGAWTQEATLAAPSSVSALALGDGFAAVSSSDYSLELMTEVARVDRWRRVDGAWSPMAAVVQPDDVPGAYPEFGAAIAVGARWLAAGSPRAGQPDFVQSGVVDVFENDEAAPRVARLEPDDELDGCGCRSSGPGGLLVGLLALGLRRRRRR